ncbi:hypothetical protein EJ05DRAFT_38512 [Pseudovirgaria hyperparasitica]|uniref:Gfd2/YDR514C-like C-terminal domain-containing protein n=1 Tax=Pseudovirgaria hyperparasitica TaxID=470096 RepID=A0A6A6WMQ5_9PEZI|nr:uncharacterized protein EJ05DRAFT_38512 [Pseudovirgaria hyperparasitica]KAF2763428.1 hypothetical protein EJ05DRAFT_38512 [Pseudovirgaria hyperparasitica]
MLETENLLWSSQSHIDIDVDSRSVSRSFSPLYTCLARIHAAIIQSPSRKQTLFDPTMYSFQRPYGPSPVPFYHHYVPQNPQYAPQHRLRSSSSFPVAPQTIPKSPPNYVNREQHPVPKGPPVRRYMQPMNKHDGLSLVAHCFGLKDASYMNIPRDVVFVAHDFEAYTPAHSGKRPVTEAGVAFFDTRTINRVGDPGQNGENWLAQIMAAHLRVEDRGHLINRHWAQSCGHQFDFGHSQWVPIEDMKTLLDRTVCIPDKGPDVPISARDMSSKPASDPDLRNRNVVLVSHAFHNDDGYMKTPDINFDYSAYGTVVGIVDTQVMGSRQGFEGMRFPALKRLCGNFNIDLLHPHNAGNDAAYTMISLVLLGLEYAHLRGYRFGRGPTNAAPAVAELMYRLKEDYIRYWLTNPPKPGYRCQICGRKNSHAAEECELHIKCEDCGCHGHRKDRCQPDWMKNAKLGYGNPTTFASEADRIKHDFAARVREAALAANAPIPLATNGHSADVIDKAFPLLPGNTESSSSGSVGCSTDKEDISDISSDVSMHAMSTASSSPPKGPAKDRARTNGQHGASSSEMQYVDRVQYRQPRIFAAGHCIVSSKSSSDPLSAIDINGRRGKKNWTKLELNFAS